MMSRRIYRGYTLVRGVDTPYIGVLMLLRIFWPLDETAWAFALEAPAFRQVSSHSASRNLLG